MLCVHHGQALDIAQAMLRHARLCLAQHRRGKIDPGEAVGPRIVPQRQPGADSDFEDTAADTLGRRDRRLAAALEHRAEYKIVNRRPAGISFGDCVFVEFRRHHCRRRTAVATAIEASSMRRGEIGAKRALRPTPRPSCWR